MPKSTDNIIHFLTCNVHAELLNNLREEMKRIKLVPDFPMNLPFFFDPNLDANHPANIIFMATLKFLYSLRYSETIPNIEMVKWNVRRLSKLSQIMYPHSYEWNMTASMYPD